MTVTTLPTAHSGRPPVDLDITYLPAHEGAPTDVPRVFTALNAAMRDISPVGKNQENTQQRYKFRGVDDVMSAVAGPFRAHGLFILPQMIDRVSERRGEKMTSVTVTMRYHVYGPAGDCLIATVPGEASDFADKATNKAQSAAMKYLLVHLFMIPVDAKSVDDGDRDHPVEHRTERQQRRQQPRRGNRAEPGPWEQPATFRPHPEGQAFAKRASEAVDRTAVTAIVGEARGAELINSGIEAPDSGEPDMLRSYLQRRWKALPERAPATPPDGVVHVETAERELRAFAEQIGLPDIAADFEGAKGLPLSEATADQIRAFLGELRGTAA